MNSLFCAYSHSQQPTFQQRNLVMIKDIHIQNYRGIKDLKIKDFKRINLLVGDNNSGKTSVLEAIGLSSNYNITGVVAFESFRESGRLPQIQVFDPKLWSNFEYLFHEKSFSEGFKISLTIKNETSESEDNITLKCILSKEVGKFLGTPVVAVIDQNQNNSLIAEYTENEKNPVVLGYSRDGTSNQISGARIFVGVSLISTATPSPEELMAMMKKVVEKNDEVLFSKIAQVIDPKIKNIKTAGDEIYADIGKISVPLKYMGDGLRKVLNIILKIRELKNGILLIDEIENGLHWKTQTILWRAVIAAAVEYNVQIIAATHSRDTIKALSEVYEEEKSLLGEDEIRLFKIKKDSEGLHHSLRYNSDMTMHVVEDEREVR